QQAGAEVMVINPKAAHHFAKARGQRNKTDAIDAAMLLDYLPRMPFRPWQPPPLAVLQLRQYGRHLVRLTDQRTRARNQLHALERKSTRLNSSHVKISYAVFCLKKTTTVLT